MISKSVNDYFKSPNSHSTNSNHSSYSNRSNHSNSSRKSQASSNSAIKNKLKYCTSSPSVSPSPPLMSDIVTSTETGTSTAIEANPCSPLAAKDAVRSQNEQVVSTSSIGSNNARLSPPTTSGLISSLHWFEASRQNVAVKRKRRSSINFNQTNDPDVVCELPLAKRLHRLPSPYKSDIGSVASSVYPSSLGYLSDDISDDDDDTIISGTTSPSACSNVSSKLSEHEYTVQSELTDQSGTTLPPSWQTQHGERTPAYVRAEIDTDDQPDYTSSQVPYDCMTPGPEASRLNPLPALAWANADDVWQLMCKKDEQAACLRSALMLEQHPSLQARMRAILLDWLIEVCEVYKLHRETYYLAVDYLDRYLSAKKNVQKTYLQLIGITCLFVAAKVEEIYPPKIGEFAYVTDGACHESDILKQEVLLLQILEWRTSSVTPMGWLGIYMQLNINNRTPAMFKDCNKGEAAEADRNSVKFNDAFIYPQFSGMEFVQTAQLLDLCSLDAEIAEFSYAVIAAAAMSHTFSRETAVRCSGLDWQTIQPCARWMEPFFIVVREESKYLHLMEQNEQIASKFGLGHICPNIVTDDSHIIQTHTISMAMFDRVCLLQEHSRTQAQKIKQEASPAIGLICPEGLLTPPASGRKPLGSAEKEVEGNDEETGLEESQNEKEDENNTDSDVDDVNVTVKAVAERHIESPT